MLNKACSRCSDLNAFSGAFPVDNDSAVLREAMTVSGRRFSGSDTMWEVQGEPAADTRRQSMEVELVGLFHQLLRLETELSLKG